MKYYLKSRDLLFGLLIACPFAEEDSNCPLAGFREGDLKSKKRLAFEELDEERLGDILSHHRTCCARRDGFRC